MRGIPSVPVPVWHRRGHFLACCQSASLHSYEHRRCERVSTNVLLPLADRRSTAARDLGF